MATTHLTTALLNSMFSFSLFKIHWFYEHAQKFKIFWAIIILVIYKTIVVNLVAMTSCECRSRRNMVVVHGWREYFDSMPVSTVSKIVYSL